MDKLFKGYYHSEIGIIEVQGTQDQILFVDFTGENAQDSSSPSPCVEECIRQLDEYFKGKRKEFSLNLKPQGTPFQMKVWNELLKIPYGHVASYKDIARAVGNAKAVRAVGNANGRNSISIIIPCHRVIGSDGSLTGYATGIWRKEWLLNHEKKFL